MAAIHKFGDLSPLPWPHGAPHVYRVERPSGHYVATYATEAEARQAARLEGGWRDAKVCRLNRTAAA